MYSTSIICCFVRENYQFRKSNTYAHVSFAWNRSRGQLSFTVWSAPPAEHIPLPEKWERQCWSKWLPIIRKIKYRLSKSQKSFQVHIYIYTARPRWRNCRPSRCFHWSSCAQFERCAPQNDLPFYHKERRDPDLHMRQQGRKCFRLFLM